MGCCVNDAVRKSLQFQINTNITAVVITFVIALLPRSRSRQTKPPLDHKPDKKTDPLFPGQKTECFCGYDKDLVLHSHHTHWFVISSRGCIVSNFFIQRLLPKLLYASLAEPLSRSPIWVLKNGSFPLLLVSLHSHWALSSVSSPTSPASVSS